MSNCKPKTEVSFDDIVTIANNPINDIFYNHDQSSDEENTDEQK